jgi:hypothetical protein
MAPTMGRGWCSAKAALKRAPAEWDVAVNVHSFEREKKVGGVGPQGI